MCVHICVCTYVCTCLCVCMCVNECMCVYMCVCVCVCLCVYSMYVHRYTYMHVHTYVCAHACDKQIYNERFATLFVCRVQLCLRGIPGCVEDRLCRLGHHTQASLKLSSASGRWRCAWWTADLHRVDEVRIPLPHPRRRHSPTKTAPM